MEFTTNQATSLDILRHFEALDQSFVDPLSSTVDLVAFSEKIRKMAFTVEAWEGKELVGLGALYLNDPTLEKGFFTHLGVLPTLQKAGLGKRLMKWAVEIADEKGFKEVGLEVYGVQQGAIRMYGTLGFVVVENSEVKWKMIRKAFAAMS